jgi:hypothetical protein
MIRQRTTTLAPRDRLIREIQHVLGLIRPELPRGKRQPRYDGYCGSAAEAYLHLAGGRKAGLKVKHDGSHWWLEDSQDRVIDLTLGPDDYRSLSRNPRKLYPYDRGKGGMFRSGYERPSRRAKAIISLVEARRAGNL